MLPTKFQFIWPSGFRGEDFFKSANQKQELPMVAMLFNGSGQNDQSLERTFHRCFQPSFTSFNWGVSEDKIKMWKVNTTDDGRQVMAKAKKWNCVQSQLTVTDENHINDSWYLTVIRLHVYNLTKQSAIVRNAIKFGCYWDNLLKLCHDSVKIKK